MDYDPDEDFHLSIHYSGNNAKFKNILTIISDPAMLTYSGIDRRSHQGTKLLGIKIGYQTLYEVKVVITDSDTPAERDSCSTSSYAVCIDQQTTDIFSKVRFKLQEKHDSKF